MVRFKEVKNYSGRMRINIIQDDNFKTGEKIAILTMNEYETLIKENKNLKQELEKNNDTDIDRLIQLALKPVTASYEKQANKLENKLNNKEKELNQLKAVFTRFITQVNGLSFFDLVFKHKHEELINDFQESIYFKHDQDVKLEVQKK